MKTGKWILALAGAILLFGVSGAMALDAGGVAIHGFVSQGYLKTDDVNYLAETKKGTYQFNEVGINFNYTHDKLRVGAQIFSRDLGDLGNNDVVLDWAVGEYRFFDEIGVRAGRIKIPNGFYNQGRDVDLLRTPVFLPSSVYEEGARDLLNAVNGFGLFGNIDASVVGEFEYEMYCGAAEMEEDSIFIRGTVEAFEKGLLSNLPPIMTASIRDMSVENKHMYGGALRWGTPVPGLRLGATYFTGENDVKSKLDASVPLAGVSTTADIIVDSIIDDGWTYSAEFTLEQLTLAAEYQQVRQSRETEIKNLDLSPLPAMSILIPDSTGQSDGWYVSASYQFFDWFTLGLYYSAYYSSDEDKDGQRYLDSNMPASYAWQKEWVPTLRFDPVPNWVIKGEVHFIDGSARCYDFNNPYGRDDNWHLYALKTSYSF